MSDSAPSVVCIGVFDGVHRGHRALLNEGRRQADERGVPLVALTFDPHPQAVVGAGAAPPTLASMDQRRELLLAAGADRVDVLSFDESVASMSPEDFIRAELVERRGARAVVVGEDFRFGRGARGSLETLQEQGSQWGFTATGVALAGAPDGERWSSTRIRALLEAGDVAAAASVLGRPYALRGTVVHGDHRGRDLGYPTANLGWDGTPAIPADGVYAGWLVRGDERLPAAVSVGTNPQFDGLERRVESYVLGRDDLDLYGQSVTVEFVARLRGQATFSSVQDLVDQMARDVTEAAAALGVRQP
ncbi:MAG TPA: hypothetical protein DCQ36_13745 [Actinobacteria bacterium]|nr:hypothetical protein [Actinomycetota bacterium]